MENQEHTFNEQGYRFEVDEILTKYIQEDKPIWGGGMQKGMDKNLVVLKVIDRSGWTVENLLFDTKTQSPIQELGTGEQCWCKLDILRVANEKN